MKKTPPASLKASLIKSVVAVFTLAASMHTSRAASGGQIDIGNNDAIIRDANYIGISGNGLAGITGDIVLGYNGGAWNGPGIISSVAAANPITGIGADVASAFNGGSGWSGPFGGVAVINPTDVLLKYTYLGDTNLDGMVNGADYNAIDGGFAFNLTGWANGDFNYDGAVNGADYNAIDTSFAFQTAVLDAGGGGVGNPQPVPEVGSIGLMTSGAMALTVLLGFRKRQHNNNQKVID